MESPAKADGKQMLSGEKAEKSLSSPSSSSSESINTQVDKYSIEDCKKMAVVIGMKDADVELFWANYAAVGWIDAMHRPVTHLRAMMSKWKANQPSHGKRSSPDAKKLSVWELGQQKSMVSDKLKSGKYFGDDVVKLREELSKLNQQIMEAGK